MVLDGADRLRIDEGANRTSDRTYNPQRSPNRFLEDRKELAGQTSLRPANNLTIFVPQWIKYAGWRLRSLPHELRALAIVRVAIWLGRATSGNAPVIINLGVTADEKSGFASAVEAALQQLRIADPRRHRRLIEQVRYIVNLPLISAANYSRWGRICLIDYGRVYLDDFLREELACSLVHESTHGLLHSKRIHPPTYGWKRIERICVTEELRFLAKVPNSDVLALQVRQNWNEEEIDFYYSQSWSDRLRSLLDRIKSSMK